MSPSRLDIRLLGPVHVLVDGRPIAVDTKKAIALLAYLAAGPQQRSRDHLADLLWADSDASRARAALRRTLSVLRRSLGGRWLDSDRSVVGFVPDEHTRIDLAEFEVDAATRHDHDAADVCERCAEPLGAAAARYRGEFMHGFGVRGAPEFDDWMLRTAEHVRRTAATTFERLSAVHAAGGRYNDAVAAARRWLDVDPLHEHAHRTLMLLHAWSGNQAGSAEAYRACVGVLDRELGVEPMEETTELYEAILDHDLPRAPAPPRTTRVAPTPAPARPLVEREEPMAVLRGLVDRGSGVAIVEGETGLGKSRLIEQLAADLEGTGATMLFGRSYRAETGVAYGPVQSLIDHVLADEAFEERLGVESPHIVAELARLRPSLGDPPSSSLAEPGAKARFFAALGDLIGLFGPPVVLAFDNLHWADTATVEWISSLSHRLVDEPLVLVLTLRPEEMPTEEAVTRLVEDLASRAQRVVLEPLSLGATATLVELAGLDTPAEDVHRWTGGLPLFVAEYLAAASSGRSETPTAVRRLLVERLHQLSPVSRQVLGAMAVIGSAAPADMVLAVSGRSEEELLAALDELLARAIVVERADGALDFVHEQLREAVLGEATIARRRALHRRTAAYLQETSVGPGRHAAAIAHHHRETGDESASAEWSEIAAVAAVAVFAFVEALEHYRLALAMGHEHPGGIHRAMGDLHTMLGDYGSALSSYRNARSHLPLGEDGEAAQVACAVGEVYRRLSRWEAAIHAYEEAWQLESDLTQRVRIAVGLAHAFHRLDRTDEATSMARRALDLAEAGGSTQAQALAHNLAAMVAVDAAERAHRLDVALTMADEPVERMAVLNNLAIAASSGGDHLRAVALGREAATLAASLRDRHRAAAIHGNLADFLHRAGDEEGAMAELKTAATLFAEIGEDPQSLQHEAWMLTEW